MTSKDPLSSLVSKDVKSTDRKKLSELLKPFLVIDGETKEFAFLSAFDQLGSNADKIEIILAGTKARALLFDVTDGATQTEIIALGVLAEGSVKSTLKRLMDSHKLKKDKEGRYSIPGYHIPELLQKFRNI